MKKPRKVSIYRAIGMGNLRTGGIARWFDDFDSGIVLEREKIAIDNGIDTTPDIDIDFEKT